MAATKIIPIRTSIQNSIDYICNHAKTDDRLLVHSEHCFPNTAGLEFQHYLNQTRSGGNTIGRHLIQSFAPGEVTPEQAHEIGKKLAAEILKGEYAFVMATHINCGHIHNHFVWCSANIVTYKKYHSNKNTYHEIRNISDRLCKENELSVIVPNPQSRGKSYDEYFPDKTSGSWRKKLQATIDSLIPEAKNFEELLELMQAQGYKIKRGKYISFNTPGQERFTRLKSLGEGYTEEAITRKILTKPERKTEEMPHKKAPPTVTPPLKPVEKLPTLKEYIDIAGNPKFAESRGLEQWAKLQNLKMTAEAFLLMQNYGGMDAFLELYNECKTDVDTLENGIKANDEQIKTLGNRKKNIADYNRTKPIYTQYEETKFFKERFRKNNESDIITHENASEELRYIPKPLPTVKDLNAKIERLKSANVINNRELTEKKAELKLCKTIHTYLFHLRLTHQPQPQQQQARTQNQAKKNDFSL